MIRLQSSMSNHIPVSAAARALTPAPRPAALVRRLRASLPLLSLTPLPPPCWLFVLLPGRAAGSGPALPCCVSLSLPRSTAVSVRRRRAARAGHEAASCAFPAVPPAARPAPAAALSSWRNAAPDGGGPAGPGAPCRGKAGPGGGRGQFCGVLGHTFMEFLKGSGDYCQAQHDLYADK
ncbi:protein tyrosine phosphatase type IVA 1 isoform X2 [Gallus gallus]|uniref:protein tyrosine phosphatase type IVA 1 isoform X2 n=1 Tax=Gallus gallus TaxID=9031 RepID=UPI001F02A85B|nr:protein tyrosine phosphatase type IVA 1 isoform X2 [Gallus gallus]